MLDSIWRCPAPVVARIQGYALGGGSGLTTCVDIAVAGEDAVFGFSEVRLGIVPGVISPMVLAKIGPNHARRYFLTGERIDAATALRIGLVDEVAADLDAAVGRVVADILAGGPDRRPRGEAARPRTRRRGRPARAGVGKEDEPRGPGRAPSLPREAPSGMGIRKLLVANRGEIAVRIFRTCRELGIATVAVAAADDAGSLHARVAGETVEIASYLHPEEHIRAAKATGADAIHPGYGFLSENADFAAAVEAASLVFVGPSPEALRAGGDKLSAKRVAREAGVPVLDEGDPASLGFPLLVKAAAGGGGRGMRVVRSAEELDEALEAARREAKAAFGDDSVFCERYVERPRHVEIQLLGDGQGAAIALGERECSVQRRHQKVLEESPSPALDPGLRAAMSDAAVRFAQAIAYRSAGTAEFMLDGRDFFFLELNGRIQVEHPVTELVTGLDLVAAQLELAEGGVLPEPPPLQGHAVEVRLYAEDPRTFLPQAGRIEHLRLPDGIRVDAGVEEGDEVGIALRPDDREADRGRARRATRRSTAWRPRSPRPRCEA